MMRFNASRSRSFGFGGVAPVVAVVVAAAPALFAPRAASAQSIEVLRPVPNAIVRETVAIKVSPRDLPPDGYVAVSIDGDVVIAKILPERGQPVFMWDTKAPYHSADDPNSPKQVSDGTHDLTITIYSSGNHLVGSATIPVRVANKISVSPQGAMLKYKWRVDETLNYHRKVVITEVASTNGAGSEAASTPSTPFAPTSPYGGNSFAPNYARFGGGGPPAGYGGPPAGMFPGYGGGGMPGAGPFGRGPFGGFGPGGPMGMGGGRSGGDSPLDTADVHFERTVEDASTSDEYLLRDKVDPEGVVSSNGNSQFVKAAYNVKSKYRTVNQFGEVLSEMPPLSAGDHFAFPIPILPGRRVNVGDSWQTPIDVSLDWMGTDPLTVTGEARLEDFEWQDGYPVAKIHETYSGAAKFPTSRKSTFSGAPVDNLKVDQTVYFAYNAGRLIRVEANNDITVQLTSAQEAALDPFTGHSGAGRMAGLDGEGGPGMGYPGRPSMGAPMGAPMMPMRGGPSPFAPQGMGEGSAVGESRTPVHLKISETTELEKSK